MSGSDFYQPEEIDFYEYDEAARRLLGQGVDLDGLIAELRRQGCPKIGCVDVVSRVAEVPLGEAKSLVHNSSAWAEVKNSDELFHQRIEKSARNVEVEE